MKPDLILVIVAPSGCGKGTTIKYLRRILLWLTLLVSYTDRPCKNGEQDGREYHFRTFDECDRLIATHELLTYGEYGGRRYFDIVPEEHHLCIILEVIITTALDVRRRFPRNTLIVNLKPAGRTEARRIRFLRRRLTGRGRETPEEISGRLAHASDEMWLGSHAADVTYTNRWSRVTAWRIAFLVQRRLLIRRIIKRLLPKWVWVWWL